MYYIRYEDGGRVVTTSPGYTVRGAIRRLREEGFYPEWYEQGRKLPHSFTDGRGAGVSESAVRSWCDGTAVPASDNSARLCDACGVSADWVLGLRGGGTPDAGR